METHSDVPLRENLEVLGLILLLTTPIIVVNFNIGPIYLLSSAQEPNPIRATEDNLLDVHVLQSEGLHLAAIDLSLT